MKPKFNRLPPSKGKFYQWVSDCCKLLGEDDMHGCHLVVDPSWHACYDDGMTPEQAVAEYREKHPDG